MSLIPNGSANNTQDVYPGGSISALYAFKNPRWEDFDYGHTAETNCNMWGWLGNGITMAQRDGKTTSDYLRNVDIPPVPKIEIENENDTKANGVVAKTNGTREEEDLNNVNSNTSGLNHGVSNITALMDVIGNAFLSLKNEIGVIGEDRKSVYAAAQIKYEHSAYGANLFVTLLFKRLLQVLDSHIQSR